MWIQIVGDEIVDRNHRTTIGKLFDEDYKHDFEHLLNQDADLIQTYKDAISETIFHANYLLQEATEKLANDCELIEDNVKELKYKQAYLNLVKIIDEFCKKSYKITDNIHTFGKTVEKNGEFFELNSPEDCYTILFESEE